MQWNRVHTKRRGEPGVRRQLLHMALMLGLLMSLVLGALAPVSSANASEAPAPVYPIPDICFDDPCLEIPYQPGPAVMDSVEVYLIFWLPDGYAFAPDIPDTAAGNELYMDLIKRYFNDIGGSPMYNIVTQYYDYETNAGFGSTTTRYYPNRLTLADSYVDTRPFPQSPLFKSDIEGAITNAMQEKSWTIDESVGRSHPSLRKLFFVYTPTGVQMCLTDPLVQCAGTHFGGYHGGFGESEQIPLGIIYSYIADLGPVAGLDGPFPNNRYADPAINTTSHELFESVTDPYNQGWRASTGVFGPLEIADLCSPYRNLAGLGPVDDSGANVTLNGNPYQLQLMYSNAAGGCTSGFYGQFINFNALGNKTDGDVPFTLSADATSLLPVTFTAEGACTVSNALVTITGAGSCSITASQAGNKPTGGFYDPATPVTRTFSIASALCQPGTFSASGAEPCALAPAGSFVATSGATAATQCSPGTFSATSGAIVCTEAPAGSYVAGAGATEATLCAAGTFQDQPGQTNCTSSPAGSFVSGIGALAATLCPAGTFSAVVGASSCTPAPAGSYVDISGAEAATLCAAGSFSATSGATACMEAPAGSYVATEGAAAANFCPAGFFSATSGAVACDPAPAGSYVDTTGAIAAIPCAPGYYQPLEAQSSCNPAPAGTFVDSTGAIAATPCAVGSYQDQLGQTSCLLAQPGYYVDTTGATAQTLCPAGTTSAAGATACQPIPVLYSISGFYQPVDMNGVVNTVKGGSTVPLKFEVFNGSVELTDPAIVTMSAKPITCATGAATDAIEEIVTTGGTGLRYDTTSGQFIYNWKTPKKAGTCYAVTATTSDGSTLTALFRLK